MKACGDVVRFQVRHLGENRLPRQALVQEVKHVRDPDAHATNARASTALLWVRGDAVEGVHGASLTCQET